MNSYITIARKGVSLAIESTYGIAILPKVFCDRSTGESVSFGHPAEPRSWETAVHRSPPRQFVRCRPACDDLGVYGEDDYQVLVPCLSGSGTQSVKSLGKLNFNCADDDEERPRSSSPVEFRDIDAENVVRGDTIQRMSNKVNTTGWGSNYETPKNIDTYTAEEVDISGDYKDYNETSSTFRDESGWLPEEFDEQASDHAVGAVPSENNPEEHTGRKCHYCGDFTYYEHLRKHEFNCLKTHQVRHWATLQNIDGDRAAADAAEKFRQKKLENMAMEGVTKTNWRESGNTVRINTALNVKSLTLRERRLYERELDLIREFLTTECPFCLKRLGEAAYVRHILYCADHAKRKQSKMIVEGFQSKVSKEKAATIKQKKEKLEKDIANGLSVIASSTVSKTAGDKPNLISRVPPKRDMAAPSVATARIGSSRPKANVPLMVTSRQIPSDPIPPIKVPIKTYAVRPPSGKGHLAKPKSNGQSIAVRPPSGKLNTLRPPSSGVKFLVRK